MDLTYKDIEKYYNYPSEITDEYELSNYSIFHNDFTKKIEHNYCIDLKVEDIVIPPFCPVFGYRLERNLGGKTAKFNSPSVDRIDPLKGYTKDNVQVLSYKANCMKNNATNEELLKFAEWILSLKE
jgi:hypothetical protein